MKSAGNKRGPKPKDRPAPAVLSSRMSPPSHLSLPARKHWGEVTDALRSAGLLTELDREALTLYIDLWDRRREAEDVIRKEGVTIKAPNGVRQLHPSYKISSQCQRDMRGYLDRLGMTPASRARLAMPETEKPDAKWADFESG